MLNVHWFYHSGRTVNTLRADTCICFLLLIPVWTILATYPQSKMLQCPKTVKTTISGNDDSVVCFRRGEPFGPTISSPARGDAGGFGWRRTAAKVNKGVQNRFEWITLFHSHHWICWLLQRQYQLYCNRGLWWCYFYSWLYPVQTMWSQ